MRLEYNFELSGIDVPRFAVEAVEGIGKLFSLGTLVLNVLADKERVEVVFHGLNPEDPGRKIEAFQEVLRTAEGSDTLRFSAGNGGRITGSSSYYQWLTVERA